MNRRIRNRTRRVRVQIVPLAILLAISVVLSGCCGGCCRGCCAGLASSGGGSSSGNNGGGFNDSPTSGSVSSLVVSRVGRFTLKGTAPVTRLGSGLRPGVVDSIGAVYVDSSGNTLNQIILAYSTAAEANARMDTVYFALQGECAGKRLQRGNVLNQQNAVIGKKVICDQNPQHVYWSNGRVLAFVTAPHPGALDFYNASPH